MGRYHTWHDGCMALNIVNPVWCEFVPTKNLTQVFNIPAAYLFWHVFWKVFGGQGKYKGRRMGNIMGTIYTVDGSWTSSYNTDIKTKLRALQNRSGIFYLEIPQKRFLVLLKHIILIMKFFIQFSLWLKFLPIQCVISYNKLITFR